MQRQVLALRWSETRPVTAVGESQRRCGRVPAQCSSADVIRFRTSCAAYLVGGTVQSPSRTARRVAQRCSDHRARHAAATGGCCAYHAARTRHARAPEAESGLSHRAIVTVPRLFGSRYSCASNRPGRAASQDAALRARCCNASQGVARCCNASQHIRAVLQRVARRCAGLQRIARYSRGVATNRNIFARCCNAVHRSVGAQRQCARTVGRAPRAEYSPIPAPPLR